MVKVGKTLKNILYGIPFIVAGLLSSNDVQAQKYTVNPFVSTNENGKEYDGLKTREQRDSLVQAKLNEDWADAYHIFPNSNPIWDCTEYARQLMINFHGFQGITGYSGENMDSIYYYHGTLKDNGKYGLPIYSIVIGQEHEMNAILTGDDATKFEDWNFVEPQFDQINVKPGEAYMPEDCEIEINAFPKDNDGKFISAIPVLKFNIKNGTPNLTWINEDPNLKIIKQREKPNGLEKEVYNLNIKVYPNPVTNFLNIENLKDGKIEIYDVSGRRINERNYREGENVDFTEYSPGMHILKAKDSKGNVYAEKVVK